MYNKEEVLRKSQGGLLIFKLLLGDLNKRNDESFHNIISPFRKERNPSFSIYQSNSNWYFKDHGDDSFKGDCFDFIAEFEGLDIKADFPEVLRIAKELIDDNHLKMSTPSKEDRKTKVCRKEVYYELFEKSFDDLSYNEKKFIEVHQLDVKKIELLNTVFIRGYQINYNDGTISNFNADKDQIFIAYKHSGGAKIYMTNPKRFRYVGSSREDYVYGFGVTSHYDLVEEGIEHKFHILTGGEKDVMTLDSMGLSAFCLNSETALIPDSLIEKIKKPVLILYDSDKTGIKSSEELCRKHGFVRVDLSNLTKRKDISDYVRYGGDLAAFEQLLFQVYGDYQTYRLLPAHQEYLESIQNKQTPITPEMSITPMSNDEDDEMEYPTIPDKVFEGLPDYFKELTLPFEGAQRTIVLLGLLGITGSVLYRIFFKHRNKKYHPNLSIFVSGPPAAGKSDILISKKLGEPIHNKLNKDFEEEYKLYKKESKAKKNDETLDLDDVPQKRVFFISGNCSSAALINQLSINNGMGYLIETEADTMIKANSQEWGLSSDEMRRNSENESISKLRANGKQGSLETEVRSPRMGLTLTGTPNQLKNMIPDPENGLFSRFIFFFLNSSDKKFNLFDEVKDLDSIIAKASGELLDIFIQLEEKDEIEFCLSDDQKSAMNDLFQRWDNEFSVLFGPFGQSSIRRLAMSVYRIALILSAIQSIKTIDIPCEIKCKEDDFNSAIQIAEVLKSHIAIAFSQVKTPEKPGQVKNLKLQFYELLPTGENFSKKTATSISEQLSIPKGTSEKYLSEFTRTGLIGKLKRDCYLKAS